MSKAAKFCSFFLGLKNPILKTIPLSLEIQIKNPALYVY